MTLSLTNEDLPAISETLAKQDKHLAVVYDAYGVPPLWAREPGFATLVHIILEQQVSLASALSAFNKLKEKVGEITPETVLSLSDDELRGCYFSRQKTVYVRALALAVGEGRLCFELLKQMPDAEVTRNLTEIKGIGQWTADIYLLMALRRADVMPRGDIALHAAWRQLAGLEARPSADEFLQIAERWSPFRAVAARFLWHYYLSEKKSSGSRKK
jgi:DNA-3-methyladenine glycosylase II